MDSPGQAEAAAPPRSAVQSIWGVLLAPEKTFRALAARPQWLAALILLVVAALVLSLVLTPRLDMRQVIRDAMEKQGQEIPEAQLERQIELAESSKWVGTISQVVLQPAIYLLMAGVFLVVFRLTGSEIDFRRSLAVTVHGMMPFLLATLLTIPILLTRPRVAMEDVQDGSFLPSNLGFLASESTGKAMHSLLASCDLFSLWTIALLALGYRIVGKVSAAAAWGVVLTLWAIVVAGKITLASIF